MTTSWRLRFHEIAEDFTSSLSEIDSRIFNCLIDGHSVPKAMIYPNGIPSITALTRRRIELLAIFKEYLESHGIHSADDLVENE